MTNGERFQRTSLFKLAAIESSENGIISDGPTFSGAATQSTDPQRTSPLLIRCLSLSKEDHVFLMEGTTTGEPKKPSAVSKRQWKWEGVKKKSRRLAGLGKNHGAKGHLGAFCRVPHALAMS